MFKLCKYLRDNVTTLIKNAKSQYIQNNLNVNRENPKKFWRTLKTVFNGNTASEVDID